MYFPHQQRHAMCRPLQVHHTELPTSRCRCRRGRPGRRLVGCTASRLGQQAADVGIELSKDASAGYVKGSGDEPKISFD